MHKFLIHFRVYDNCQANAVMQKAIMILGFWDGMSDSSQNKFLDYIEQNCSPYKEFYDDDMTEEGGEDLKKATLQIKVCECTVCLEIEENKHTRVIQEVMRTHV